MTTALEFYQKALLWSDMTGSPTTPGTRALSAISQVMIRTGNILGALQYATKAQEYAEHVGNIYLQGRCLCQQGGCLLMLGNYQQGQYVLENARNLLDSCGLQEGSAYDEIINHEAEVLLLKTEYLESRHVQSSIPSRVPATTYTAILANLNIAAIDTVTGVDSKLVHRNLNTCQSHIRRLQGWIQTNLIVEVNKTLANLSLRDGDHITANVLLTQTFTSSRDIFVEGALACLSILSDLSTGMSSAQTTLGWVGIFLTLALKSKDKLSTMKAFRCLGQIFVAQGDDGTALSLFTVALDGLTFMDVHHWRADCMVQIADI
jgi:tetratricopeptide (TPR) repeat protein